MEVADPGRDGRRITFKRRIPVKKKTPSRGKLTVLPHDQHVSTLILRGQEDLRHHNQDLALAGGVDVPNALHISGVIAGIVGRLDVTHKLTHLAATLPV